MKKGTVYKRENIAWIYFAVKDKNHDEHKCGKWMYFFTDKKFAAKVCFRAVNDGIVASAKYSNAEKGVCCFYLNCDDNETHENVIRFFLDNNLIQKTKTGRLYNISFKLDTQTGAREYGKNFTSEIRLDKFLDLDTGEWLRKPS